MTQKITDQLLVECLDLLEQGVSVVTILSRYPQQAEELLPYLETAVSLDNLASSPALGQKQQSQQAMLAQATALQGEQMARPPVWDWLRRLLMPLMALTVLLFLFAGGLLTASATALPGDVLYDSKRWTEQMQLQWAQSPEQKLALVAAQQMERVREVQALLRTDRHVDVSFDGSIQEITPDYWTIADIRAQLTDETEIVGTPQVTALVRVNGRVQHGQLLATHLELLTYTPIQEDTPEVEPIPTSRPIFSSTATATATPTATAQFTATATATTTATATETAVPTSISTPTKTAVPTSTPSPSPMPSATVAPPPDNDNDNDDNGNSNDDNDNDDNSNDDNENDDNSNDDNGNENEDDDDDANDNDNH